MNDKDKTFIDALLKQAPSVEVYQSSSPLLEQLIDNILLEDGPSNEVVTTLKTGLLQEFVDWNEIRIVSSDRLASYFQELINGDYKRMALQALLNKIFSRSGSLDYQFLMDFEANDLEDYLTGIMELRENTIKRLMLRVFKKNVSPVTTDHEIVLEVAGCSLIPGSEDIKTVFKAYQVEQLEGIQLLLNKILKEDLAKREEGQMASVEDFNSPTLKNILAQL